MRRESKIAAAMVVCIPIFVLMINIRYMAFNNDYYIQQFEENNVFDKFNNTEEVIDANDKLLAYLNNKDNLETEFFNEKEFQHLRDVKNFLQINLQLAIIMTIILAWIAYYLIKKNDYNLLSKALLIGGGLALVKMLVSLVLVLADFSGAFLRFHEILFTNDLWRLNPATSNLVKMFPEQFFYNISKEIILNSLFTTLVIIGIGLVLLLKNGKKGKQGKRRKSR